MAISSITNPLGKRRRCEYAADVGRIVAIALLVVAVGCRQAAGIDDLQPQAGSGATAGNPTSGNGAAGAGNHGAGGTGGVGAGGLGGRGGAGELPPMLGPEGTSCAAGLDCGGVSCCETRLVPGGTFPMGRSASGSDAFGGGDDDEIPEHDATVDHYYLDTFEVTVGRFRAFVDAWPLPLPVGAGAHPYHPASGWSQALNNKFSTAADLIDDIQCANGISVTNWTVTPTTNENMPMNCVTFADSLGFCIWDGGRLPTEAEWERAAAGGEENRRYPWGAEEATAELAHYQESFYMPNVDVHQFPLGRGRWGHFNLAGGVYERVIDRYDPDWYAGEGSNCFNCLNLIPGVLHLSRRQLVQHRNVPARDAPQRRR